MPFDGDADLGKEPFRHRSGRDRNGRLALTRTLEGVARVGEPVLHRARQVRVAGAGQRDRLRSLSLRFALRRPRAHPPRPVLVVAVADDERNGRPERAPVPEPGEHLDHVLLELLARAPAVALLAASEVGRPSAWYARSTTPSSGRGSTIKSSRTGVALTIRSQPKASGGHSPLREKTRTSPASAGWSAFAAPPAPIRHTRVASTPATISLSVLNPSRRPSRNTSVFTASPSASSQNATTASLWGTVTFAPTKPSARSPATASPSPSGATSSGT